ncbi:MAG: hypothetical protein PHN42_04730 [Bacilli bacterium]|nr:hypothetical protein [Bacilli bacterium]
MKKFIFAVVMLLVVIPFSVNAEECTDYMVASYLPQANSVYMQYVATSNPDTYKMYVYGLSSGLSYDGINGTEFSDGYYAYATAGDTFTISIKISDGSVCALRTIKTLSISVPSNTTVTEPVVEPTPPSNNSTTNNNTTNSTTTSPSTSTNSGTTSSSTNNESTNSNASTNSETDNNATSEDVKTDTSTDITVTENSEVQDSKEILTSKATSQNNNSIIKYIAILIAIVSLSGIGIFIYFKKFKGAKK